RRLTSERRIGKFTNIAVNTLIGVAASVEAAPARNAISARRKPQASTIGWEIRVRFFTTRAGAWDRRRRRQTAWATWTERRTAPASRPRRAPGGCRRVPPAG